MMTRSWPACAWNCWDLSVRLVPPRSGARSEPVRGHSTRAAHGSMRASCELVQYGAESAPLVPWSATMPARKPRTLPDLGHRRPWLADLFRSISKVGTRGQTTSLDQVLNLANEASVGLSRGQIVSVLQGLQSLGYGKYHKGTPIHPVEFTWLVDSDELLAVIDGSLSETELRREQRAPFLKVQAVLRLEMNGRWRADELGRALSDISFLYDLQLAMYLIKQDAVKAWGKEMAIIYRMVPYYRDSSMAPSPLDPTLLLGQPICSASRRSSDISRT
jgi:hypothetical protein